jgi:hypothetical protein
MMVNPMMAQQMIYGDMNNPLAYSSMTKPIMMIPMMMGTQLMMGATNDEYATANDDKLYTRPTQADMQ